jgi:pimeloyl-ACP methyl ester carboxylesterase
VHNVASIHKDFFIKGEVMKYLKKVLIGLAAFILVMVSMYFLFPGLVIDFSIRMARLSAGVQRHEIISDNTKWIYLDGGKGDVIVFLHGFGMNKDLLGKMLPAFSRSFRVIAPDLPGFGETGIVNDEMYTATQEAVKLENFIRSLNIQSFHLVGISMSGGIAGLYAAMHPGRIKSLTLIGPFGVQSDVKSDFRKAYDDGQIPIIFKTAEGFDLSMSYGRNKQEKMPSHFKSYLAKESAKTYDFYIRAFHHEINSEGWDILRKDLKKIQSPVLVIFGYKDRIFDVSCIDIFKKEIKNVQTHIIKDSGHITYFDKPDETITVIKDFIIANSRRE